MNIQFEESRRLKARFLLHMKKDKINISQLRRLGGTIHEGFGGRR